MRLIEEVNNQKSNNNSRDLDNDSDSQVIPREGNIGVRSSLIDYNNSNGQCSEMIQSSGALIKKTRAQAVPMAQKLTHVFNQPSKTFNGVPHLQQPQDILSLGQQLDHLNFQSSQSSVR